MNVKQLTSQFQIPKSTGRRGRLEAPFLCPGLTQMQRERDKSENIFIHDYQAAGIVNSVNPNGSNKTQSNYYPRRCGSISQTESNPTCGRSKGSRVTTSRPITGRALITPYMGHLQLKRNNQTPTKASANNQHGVRNSADGGEINHMSHMNNINHINHMNHTNNINNINHNTMNTMNNNRQTKEYKNSRTRENSHYSTLVGSGATSINLGSSTHNRSISINCSRKQSAMHNENADQRSLARLNNQAKNLLELSYPSSTNLERKYSVGNGSYMQATGYGVSAFNQGFTDSNYDFNNPVLVNNKAIYKKTKELNRIIQENTKWNKLLLKRFQRKHKFLLSGVSKQIPIRRIDITQPFSPPKTIQNRSESDIVRQSRLLSNTSKYINGENIQPLNNTSNILQGGEREQSGESVTDRGLENNKKLPTLLHNNKKKIISESMKDLSALSLEQINNNVENGGENVKSDKITGIPHKGYISDPLSQFIEEMTKSQEKESPFNNILLKNIKGRNNHLEIDEYSSDILESGEILRGGDKDVIGNCISTQTRPQQRHNVSTTACIPSIRVSVFSTSRGRGTQGGQGGLSNNNREKTINKSRAEGAKQNKSIGNIYDNQSQEQPLIKLIPCDFMEEFDVRTSLQKRKSEKNKSMNSNHRMNSKILNMKELDDNNIIRVPQVRMSTDRFAHSSKKVYGEYINNLNTDDLSDTSDAYSDHITDTPDKRRRGQNSVVDIHSRRGSAPQSPPQSFENILEFGQQFNKKLEAGEYSNYSPSKAKRRACLDEGCFDDCLPNSPLKPWSNITSPQGTNSHILGNNRIM